MYDFVCNTCGLREERIVQSHITQLKCGSCVGGTLERQAAAPGFILKGAGWPGKDIKHDSR